MTQHRAEAEGPALLASLLHKLVEGQYDLWQQVAGRRDLLRAALRQAVREADSSPDVAALLDRCWELLSDDRTGRRVAEFYRRDPDYEQVSVDDERVLLGARKLLATAQAAMAARQIGTVPGAAAHLDRWSRQAVELFGTPGQVPADPAPGQLVEDPTECVRRVYQRLGGRAGGALYWTLHWLDATSPEDIVKVPVVGYHATMGGFCADLRLRFIAGERELVEHPDMALRPLGPELRDVILDACRAAIPGRDPPDGATGTRSICWSLMMRDRTLDPLVPLDGGSLSGAARAGLLLLHAGQHCDPRAVIVARSDQGGALHPVGFERDKLEAASTSGLRRAVVAPGAALSEADGDNLEARGLKVHRAPDVPSAVKLVRGRRTRQRSVALVAASVAVAVAVVLFVVVRSTPSEHGTQASNVPATPTAPAGSPPALSLTFLPDVPPVDAGLKYVVSADPGPSVWNGQWRHVAVTYDNQKGLARFFLDGMEVGSGAHASEDIVYGLPTTEDLYIGAYGNEACPQPFVGDLDEVALWNRALTPEEVTRRATDQGAVEPSGLAAEWRFDEGTGQAVADSSGLGNNGQGVGGDPLSWVDGRRGKALHFTGTNSVMVPDSVSLASPHLTLEAWVRAARSPGDSRYLVGKGANGCNASSYALYTGAGGGLMAYIANETQPSRPGVMPERSFTSADCGYGRQSSNRYFFVRTCVRHDSQGFTAAIIVQNVTSVSRIVLPTVAVSFANRNGSDRREQWKGQLDRTVARPGEQVTYTAQGPTTTECAGIQARAETQPPSPWASSPFKDDGNARCPNPQHWDSGPPAPDGPAR